MPDIFPQADRDGGDNEDEPLDLTIRQAAPSFRYIVHLPIIIPKSLKSLPLRPQLIYLNNPLRIKLAVIGGLPSSRAQIDNCPI